MSLWKEKEERRKNTKARLDVYACLLGARLIKILYLARTSEAFISGHRRLLRADFRSMVREVISADTTPLPFFIRRERMQRSIVWDSSFVCGICECSVVMCVCVNALTFGHSVCVCVLKCSYFRTQS